MRHTTRISLTERQLEVLLGSVRTYRESFREVLLDPEEDPWPFGEATIEVCDELEAKTKAALGRVNYRKATP